MSVGPVELVLFLAVVAALLLGPVVAGVYLAIRLNRRRDGRPAGS